MSPISRRGPLSLPKTIWGSPAGKKRLAKRLVAGMTCWDGPDTAGPVEKDTLLSHATPPSTRIHTALRVSSDRMRRPLLRAPLLLCSALLLSTGCESMKPRAVSPSDGTTATEQPDASAPTEASVLDAGTPATATDTTPSPWQRARVGDRVEYAFSAHRGRPGADTGVGVAGHVVLEVIAVQAPWAWLTVTFTDDQGKPLAHPRLSQPRVLPMRMEETTRIVVSERFVDTVNRLGASDVVYREISVE